MKRLMITAALAMSVAGAFAQGTITFNNGATTTIVWGPTPGQIPGGAVRGAAIEGSYGIKVGLFYNTGGTTFTLVSPTPYLGTTSSGATNAAFNGRFNAGTVTVQGLVAGQSGNFQVRAWQGSFASYDAANAAGGYVGSSATFSNPSGGAIDPGTGIPGAAASLSGFTSGFGVVSVIPEPSTLVLAGLGIGALALIRRRK